MSLTAEQLKQYVENPYHPCPYCGSQYVTTEDPAYDDSDFCVNIKLTCYGCKKEYKEIYTFANIQEIN